MNYTQHQLSRAFPSMTDEDLRSLTEDIRAHGQREPVVLFEGQVLDGWHRAQACVALGIALQTVEFPESGDPVAYVKSRNLHRRHMTDSQRAFSVTECSKWQRQGTNQHGPAGPLLKDEAPETGRSQRTLPQSNAEMAADADVSVETIKRAKRVAKDAPEDVKQAVRDGKISVRKAAELIGDRKPKKAAKADPVGDDAHGDFDPVAELERLQAEVQTLQSEVKAAEADDAKAEVLKWRRIAEQAQRRQSELMGTVADREKKLQKLSQRMQRIGKLFGEQDMAKIPALVESFYRAHAKVAA